MSEEICYHCDQEIPSGQSFYQDHGVLVCLACFRDAERCQGCDFPAKVLKADPNRGKICEFCAAIAVPDSGMECFLCDQAIPSKASYYEDYGKTVCQRCFQDTKRCFLCRFPQEHRKQRGMGNLCQFCDVEALEASSDLDAFLKPLYKFLRPYWHQAPSNVVLDWVDWRLILGMQSEEAGTQPIRSLEEFSQQALPVFFLKNKFYVIPRIRHPWFMSAMAGQLTAADLCQHHDLPHLQGDSPFHELARGWCHWISYWTALKLNYDDVRRQLKFFPEAPKTGNFQQFLAMSDYRKPSEMLHYARSHLQDYAARYLG